MHFEGCLCGKGWGCVGNRMRIKPMGLPWRGVATCLNPAGAFKAKSIRSSIVWVSSPGITLFEPMCHPSPEPLAYWMGLRLRIGLRLGVRGVVFADLADRICRGSRTCLSRFTFLCGLFFLFVRSAWFVVKHSFRGTVTSLAGDLYYALIFAYPKNNKISKIIGFRLCRMAQRRAVLAQWGN